MYVHTDNIIIYSYKLLSRDLFIFYICFDVVSPIASKRKNRFDYLMEKNNLVTYITRFQLQRNLFLFLYIE